MVAIQELEAELAHELGNALEIAGWAVFSRCAAPRTLPRRTRCDRLFPGVVVCVQVVNFSLRKSQAVATSINFCMNNVLTWAGLSLKGYRLFSKWYAASGLLRTWA
jgi:hypothetical protein